MAPGAAGADLRVEHDEIEAGTAEVVGNCQACLTAPDDHDVMVGFAHAERFCGAIATADRSAAGFIAFPAAFLSE